MIVNNKLICTNTIINHYIIFYLMLGGRELDSRCPQGGSLPLQMLSLKIRLWRDLQVSYLVPHLIY